MGLDKKAFRLEVLPLTRLDTALKEKLRHSYTLYWKKLLLSEHYTDGKQASP